MRGYLLALPDNPLDMDLPQNRLGRAWILQLLFCLGAVAAMGLLTLLVCLCSGETGADPRHGALEAADLVPLLADTLPF